MRRLTPAAAMMLALSGTAMAAPQVATDIAPVHALAARVMAGVGAPSLIVPPGASPHGYALRPSEAAALERADVVFWVGAALTPWLEGAIDALAGDAAAVELRDAPGVALLPLREGATFAPHEHGGEDDHDQAAEAAAVEHGHEHAAEAAAHGGDHAHDHAGYDEHLWLDPENAKAWLNVMAEALSAADPANAAIYAANASAGRAELDALSAEIAATLAPVQGRPFVVFHDAYQYFEARFGVPAAGAVTLSDATAPSAARVAEIRAVMERLGAACVFAEPQFSTGVVDVIAEGTGARVGVLDPLGAALPPGPALYADLLRGLAGAMADCLAPKA